METNPIIAEYPVSIIKVKEILNRLWDRDRTIDQWKSPGLQSPIWTWSIIWNQARTDVRNQIKERYQSYFTNDDSANESLVKSMQCITTFKADICWCEIRERMSKYIWTSQGNSTGNQCFLQAKVLGNFALKEFLNLDYEHPAFDLFRLGVFVINDDDDNKFKIFGKKGIFLNEFHEREIE